MPGRKPKGSELKSRENLPNMATHVTVAIPYHCSSLSKISERIGQFSAECLANKGDSDDYSASSQQKQKQVTKKRRREEFSSSSSPKLQFLHRSHLIGILAIQCHLDRIVWNEFRPMVSESFSRKPMSRLALYKAVLILLRRFKTHICPIDGDEATMDMDTCDGELAGTHGVGTGDSIDSECDTDARNFYYEQHIHISNSRKRRKKTRHLLLFILPPYPHHKADAPSLEPERIFTPRLVKLENIMLRLQSLNAFFSTLGGGYFLCRYLSIAVRLARSQRAIALSLGDRNLAARCTVNEAYNYIHAGKIKHALMLLKQVQAAAVDRDDELTISMCKSARLFAKRVRKANAFEGTKQSVDDELQRIRIVKDDSKINRTFKPLQEL